MNYPARTRSLLAIAGLASAVTASAATVFQDNFASGDRTGWYTFTNSSGTSSVNGAAGTFTVAPQSGVSFATITYFTPTALAVGQSIELTFTFSAAGPLNANASGGFRFGLFNSQGSGISADQTSSVANAAFNNDLGYASVYSMSTNAAHTKWISERATANDTFWTNTAFTQLGLAESPSTPTQNIALNTNHTASLLITYTDASTVTIASTINGVTLTRTDTAALLTNFDSLSLFTDGRAGAITFSDVAVNTSAIPEPSTFAALAGLAGLGLAAASRRRSGR